MTKLYLYLLLVLFIYSLTHAQWSNDPTVNTPICTAPNIQGKPAIVNDGSGGAIMAWDDDRANTFNNDIYAQKVDASGTVQWAADGVAICTAAGYQTDVFVINDGAGGAIVVWNDRRNGFPNLDVYAQHINSSGNVLWTTNGIAVCNDINYQFVNDVISDGSGGAIIVWEDYRSGSTSDIYAQRIDNSGNLLWNSNGVPISTAANQQYLARLISDFNNGAIVAFHSDLGSVGNLLSTVYAQKINSNGIVQWPTNGVEICSPGPNQSTTITPKICTDGNGGAIIAWDDERSGTGTDVYAQRINSSGVTQWVANGVAISDSIGILEGGVAIASDNSGGAILTWLDERNGNGLHLYAQRVNSNGDFIWTSTGIPIYEIDNTSPFDLQVIGDSSGGVIINWTDNTSFTDYNLFSQKIDSTGNIQWNAGGVAVSTANNIQNEQKITTDGQGGAIAVWTDWRTGGLDIYAQRIFQDGVLPVELSSFSASITGSTVELNWITMTEVNNYGFEIERMSEKNPSWQKIGFVAGNGNSNSLKTYTFIDSESQPGKYVYRLKQIDNDGAFEYSNEIEVEFGNPTSFLLEQNFPNPFNPTTKISWQSPVGSHQTLKVYDMLGNELATLVDEFREAGSYEVEFNAAQLSSGVYFYKLEAGPFIQTRKMILMR